MVRRDPWVRWDLLDLPVRRGYGARTEYRDHRGRPGFQACRDRAAQRVPPGRRDFRDLPGPLVRKARLV